MDYPDPVIDRQFDHLAIFDARMRAHLRTLVSPEVIEEHRRKPLGQHGDALARLLNYFRRGGLAGKYGLLKIDPAREEYRIVVFSGQRGAASEIDMSKTFTSKEDGYHGVFLRRIADLMAD